MIDESWAKSTEYDVIVIGGGVAGLSSAFFLRRVDPTIRISVIEREDVLGGKIRTERHDGFTIEGGPESFLTTKPGGIDLCSQLGLLSELHGPDPARQRTFVMRKSQLLPMPQGLSGLTPSRIGPFFRSSLLSPAGKLRLALDLVIPAHLGAQDESLADFVTRRFGAEAYERLIEALMAGIYAGDGRQLSLDATFPQLRAAELRYGSVIRGIGKARSSAEPARQLPVFVTPRNGMSELVRALLEGLDNVHLHIGHEADQVAKAGGRYLVTVDNKRLTAHALILATPAFEAGRLLSRLNPKAASLLRTIPYVSTATVSLGYHRQDVQHPLNGYGYIIPPSEGRQILACTWMSSKYPDRAPPSHVLLRAFVGRAGQESVLNLSGDEIIGLVRRELARTLGISRNPTIQRVFRWPDAMPQPTMGHRARIESLGAELENSPGLFIAGNAYQGIGIPDTVDTASVAAAAAAHHLRRCKTEATGPGGMSIRAV